MPLTTPPLAPKIVATLATLGIHTRQALREYNPCRAFLLLKQSGLSVTQSVFWQLVALCEHTSPPELSPEQRQFWQQQLQQHPPVALFPPLAEMEQYMHMALAQAQYGAEHGEIPVGAIMVHQGEVIARAHNRVIHDHSVCQHAEMQAITQAGQVLGNYRLSDCDLYVTLEPCVMCAGAIMQARIRRLIFATAEHKTGAVGSVLNVFANKQLNAHTAVYSGVLAQEAQAVLQAFFQQRRK